MKKGKAYIIGAGPGDFELLTLKAKRIIENADCIVYDRLISDDILRLAKKDVEFIYLGKENTEGGVIQNEINQTLIKKCLEGKNVARVKGGDPFVFGRGGEEIEALFKNKIEFEVIPGVTSSISVPAYAGIPVTHRGLARSFHIFTGHTMENGKWHNFENIAKLEGTLIFLMGVKNLDLIVNDLIKYGKAVEMSENISKRGGIPVELPFIEIENLKIDLKDLKKYKAILFNSPNGVKAFFENIKDIRYLANIEIGAVGVKTKEILEKYKIVPDFVPDEYLVDKLAEEVVKYTNENDNILIVTSDISPCDIDKYNSLYKRNYEKVVAYNTKKLKINKEEVLETLKDVDIITFLSSSTVEVFYESLDGDFFILGDKKIASIGPMTSETIRRLGMKVDYEAEKYTADGLLDVIFK